MNTMSKKKKFKHTLCNSLQITIKLWQALFVLKTYVMGSFACKITTVKVNKILQLVRNHPEHPSNHPTPH